MTLTSPSDRAPRSGWQPDRQSGPQSGLKDEQLAHSGSGFLLALMFLLLLLPINIDFLGAQLSPYRIFLLILFLPMILQLLSRAAGRRTWVDFGVFGCSGMMVLTLVYHHGLTKLPYAVILALEMCGGYLIGRILVRSVADYRRFIRYFLWTLLILSPLAVYELVRGHMVLSDILDQAFNVTHKNPEFRLGLSRVQVAFPHSILYGLFCSLALASTYYLYRGSFLRVAPKLALVIGMTLMSLSSAPMLSVAIQTGMILWDKITNGRWKLLLGLVALAYGFLQTFTNRGAVVIFIQNFTLDPATGWARIYIWKFGTKNVAANPLLGIGLNDWDRPYWLTGSVDNFWLLMAMRYGLPCLALLLSAIAVHIWRIQRQQNLDAGTQSVRTGYMITLVGLIFVLSTVWIWDEMAFFVMFFLGAGAFLYTTPAEAEPLAAAEQAGTAAPGPRPALPFSRFPQKSLRGAAQAPPLRMTR